MRLILVCGAVAVAVSGACPEMIGPANAGGTGIDLQSCSEFKRFYAQDPEKTELYFFNWAQGFLSGLDYMSEAVTGMSVFKEASNFSTEIIKARIREYCDNHPLAHYYEAVAEAYMKH